MGIYDTDPNTPNKEFAPEGWHVPSDAEWTTLENYLIANGYDASTTPGIDIGFAMASTTGWNNSYPALSLNNRSGFNAFPESYRYLNGSFYNEGSFAIFWSSTENDANTAWDRNISFDFGLPYLDRLGYNKRDGFSVRFVRD